MNRPTRRRLVAVAGSGLVALAGCADQGDDDERSTRAGSTSETGASATPTPSVRTDGGTDTPDLDLREANVVDVAIESAGDGQYRFDVTLYHDDDGEDGYANWWQVETLGGEQLGRRKLLHAHSTAPFTRSETVSVPDDVDCVVVRGHDQTHGYGGQAMTVSVPGGVTNAIQQGSDREPLDAGDCPGR